MTEHLEKIETVCAELRQEGAPVTFTEIARRAGVSRTTLYRNPQYRAVIDEHRTAVMRPHTLTDLAKEIGHARTALEAIAKRVSDHEERIRKLEPTRQTRTG